MVHRDRKPQNVKASSDGTVKVLDFGLAKAMDATGGAPASASELAKSPTLTMGATLQGVILGTAAGGIQTWEDSYRAVFADGKNRVSPLVVPRLMLNAPASHLSIRFGLMGPVLAVSSACASANHAMGLALQQVRAGAAVGMPAGRTGARQAPDGMACRPSGQYRAVAICGLRRRARSCGPAVLWWGCRSIARLPCAARRGPDARSVDGRPPRPCDDAAAAQSDARPERSGLGRCALRSCARPDRH